MAILQNNKSKNTCIQGYFCFDNLTNILDKGADFVNIILFLFENLYLIIWHKIANIFHINHFNRYFDFTFFTDEFCECLKEQSPIRGL